MYVRALPVLATLLPDWFPYHTGDVYRTLPYHEVCHISHVLRYTLERERNNKHRHLRGGWRGTKNHIFLSSTGVGLLGHMPVRLEAGIRSIGQRETIIRPFFFSSALAFVRSNTLTFVFVDMSRSNYLVACPG